MQAPLTGPAGQVRVTLLDRTGKALNIPVNARELDADGVHWVAGDVPLAPLAASEYLVEVEAGGTKLLTAFVIVS